MASTTIKAGELFYCRVNYSKPVYELALRALDTKPPGGAMEEIMAVDGGGQVYVIHANEHGTSLRKMGIFDRIKYMNMPRKPGERFKITANGKKEYLPMVESHIPPIKVVRKVNLETALKDFKFDIADDVKKS